MRAVARGGTLFLVALMLAGCGRNAVRGDAGADGASGGTGGGDAGGGGGGGAGASGGAAGGTGGGEAGRGGQGGQGEGGAGGAAGGGVGGRGAAGGQGGAGGNSTCASAMAQAACATEGTVCSSGCTDICQFCQLLRCQGGKWMPQEAFPAPCFACGPTLRCQTSAQYCQAVMGGPVGAMPSYQCRATPSGCLPTPTCTCLNQQSPPPPGSATCQQAAAGELTVTVQAQ